MFDSRLTDSVEDFAALLLPLSEADLELDWKWKDHEEEGIRFAFFVTLEELRQLAVTLSRLRARPTPAQHILGQYHAAYMDLQAALLGVSAEDAERAPAEGECSIRRVYVHILSTEINFRAVLRYALERHRAGTWKSNPMSDEDAARIIGLSEEEYDALMKSPLENMQSYHRTFHPWIVEEFSKIGAQELELPSTFWEETRFSIRHRLHRYEAHLAQHTTQIDKTLMTTGPAPGESKRLIRKIYAALAEAEGMMIGAERMAEAAILASASSILEQTDEIGNLL